MIEGDVIQLSRGDGPAVSRYFDVPIEAPDDSGRIVYFEFDDAVPGPGSVIVAEADGSQPRVVGRAAEAIGHVGAQHCWLTADRIAYSPRQQSEPGAVIVDLNGREVGRVNANVRSVDAERGRVILSADAGGAGANRERAGQALSICDLADGQVRPLTDIHAGHAVHPRRETFDVLTGNLQNPKFSPDGQQIMVVYGTEAYRRKHGQDAAATIKCLLIMNVDGSGLRYITEFAHHPMWTPDGQALVSYCHNDRGGQDLVQHDLNGGGNTVLATDVPGTHPTLSDDQTAIITDVFNHPRDGQASVIRYRLADGQITTLAVGNHAKYGHVDGSHPHPQFSRDRRRVFFNMADTGAPQLYAARL